MSSFLSLKGGTSTLNPVSLWYKSFLNLPFSISSLKSLSVETINLTSTLFALVPPTLLYSPYSITLKILVWILISIPAISSKNRVPPSISSSTPFLLEIAPGNAPLSYPKSSLSRVSLVIVPQFIVT